MDTKEIVITIAAGVALSAAAYFVVRKVLDAQTVATPESGTTIVEQPTPPTFVPSSAAYAPIGAITSNPSSASAPPGVDPADLNLTTVKMPDMQALPRVDLGIAGNNAPPAGSALQPTDIHSSAPTLVGNAAIVDAEYLKIFGRHAEQAGLDYWTAAINSGGLKPADLDTKLIKGAQNSDIGASDTLQPGLVISTYSK